MSGLSWHRSMSLLQCPTNLLLVSVGHVFPSMAAEGAEHRW
jgi:hypothetical protein